MRIVSWNVNGIRAVHRNGFWSGAFSMQPDILCIQETKAHEEQVPEEVRETPGFHSFFNASQTKKGYSGTALYSKRAPLDVSYDLPDSITEKHGLGSDSYGEVNREGRVITAEFPEFFVVNVYTPNAKDDLSRVELRQKHWDPAFLEHCVQLQEKKPVIFCGDLNVAHTEIDLARPKENDGKKGFTKEEREGFENMLEEGFEDTFRTFTPDGGYYSWWSPWGSARERNVGWRIDYIMAGAHISEQLIDAKIHADIYGSDHCPVSADFEF